ncbi:hypothetical protein BKA69DRAFT_1092627 [Paraphysoderma sedebokerense]|nr:hypothetical protein BKA69DRAFT_1092627 [Paraphysoderma sedebokerense]
MRSVQHHIPIIKESNIIAKELSKSVMYQLTILSSSIYYTPPNQTHSLTSFWESSSSLNLHSSSSSSSSSSSQSISSSVSSSLTSDDIPTLLSSNTHILAVKVYDIPHKKIYYHSLPDFKKRLIQMRNQYNLLTKPNLKVHFQDYDPFIDTLESKKEYQLLGFSRLPLLSLFNDHSSPSFTNTIVANKPVKLSIPIIQNGTGDVTGWLNVVVTVLKPNLKQSLSSSSLSSSSLSKAIQESEQTVLMDVRIDSAHGVSKNWTQLHVQFRVPEWSGRMGSTSGSISSIKEIVELGDGLNKLGVEDGQEDEEMKVYATDLMEVNDEGVVFWRFNQTVKIVGKEVNPKFLKWVENGLVFEVWGKSESDVREDAKSEMKSYERYVTAAPSLSSPEKTSHLRILSMPQLSKPTGSQLSSSKHEFISYMSISELSPSGTYEPVNIQLDPSLASHHGTFILQQGVQRRMNLSFEVIFSSSLTTVFQLNTVKDIILSEVRLLDNKNRIVFSSSSTSPSSLSPSTQNVSHKKNSSVPVILPIQPNNIVVSTNQAGRQILQLQVPWDSSLHDSVHFNTVTPSNCKVLFNISVALGVTHRSLASSSTGSLPEEEPSDEEDKNKEESREEEQDEEITLSWDCECQIYNRLTRDSSVNSGM